MFHPLIEDLTHLSDSELEDKIRQLTKHYFASVRFSPTASQQILMLLESHKEEQYARQQKRIEQSKEGYNPDLDGLINIG